MTNSLTECAVENCTNLCCSYICNSCSGIDISDVPTNNNVSSETTFLGTDSYGYTAAQIAAFISNNKPNDVIVELTANQNQVSNVDAYICSAALNINLISADTATRTLLVVSLVGAVTVTPNGTETINGLTTPFNVGVGEWALFIPYDAGLEWRKCC
jgi:hypothetical protein